MLATLPHNRLGYDAPPPAKVSLPATARERGLLWSDAVFSAVLTLKNQLASRSEAVAAAAANSILELERTRMRHGKTVAGSSLDSEESDRSDVGDDDGSDRLETLGELPDLEPPQCEPPETETLAGHTAEVLKAIPLIGTKPTTRSAAERIVRGFLNQQVIEAEDIAPGQFMAHFRQHLRKSAASAVPN